MKREHDRPAGPASELTLPAPGVAFPPDMLRRLEQLVVRITSARERREGAGRARISGVGEEFVGFRPYRPGEDLRHLDWNLFARLDRPFVRVMQREAAERWTVQVDGSASMGVGPPGKLQAAAELACALCCLGLRAAARIEVVVSGSPARGFAVRKKSDLPGLLAFFEATRAGGASGIEQLLVNARGFRDAGRVYVVGDLLDVEPADVAQLVRRSREIFVAQILAPIELIPSAMGAVEWIDPEEGRSLRMNLDARARAAYDSTLEERLERWRTFCARHRIAYGCWSSRTVFEDVCLDLLSN